MTSLARWWLGATIVTLLAAACAGSTEEDGLPASGGSSGTDGGGGVGAAAGTGGTPTFPSCQDGQKGSGETDVDCGGNCPPCADGDKCESDGDCATAQCVSGVCGGCDAASPCSAGQACVAGVCKPCTSNAQCPTGQACVAGKCGSCSAGAGCAAGQACIGGKCGPCVTSADCSGGEICTSGVCGPCGASDQCDAGQVCKAGACVPCSTAADCAAGEACIGGACGPCAKNADCALGKVCDVGSCLTGVEVPMYQCPPSQSIGGGAWGYYGCQNQLASTPTCTIIEHPNQQSFNCTPAGTLSLVTADVPAAPGTTRVPMYQCPPSQSLGGGSWGYYGCQNQLSSTPTCTIIEYPNQQSFSCTLVGKLTLSTSTPTPPPGGKVVPMYQCPPSQSLGGGSWGYYGCQNHLASTPTCTVIEYPNQQSFNCAAAGSLVLAP